MLAIVALALFLAAAIVALVISPRAWPEALLALGLAFWLWETGAGLIP
jgi:hypothetical protein